MAEFKLLWGPLTDTVCFESDLSNDRVMWRYVSGVLWFVWYNPIRWSSKNQGYIKTSSFSSELYSGQVAREEAIIMRYMLGYFDIPVKVPTDPCGDNLSMVISITNPDSEFKNKDVAISYHKLR